MSLKEQHVYRTTNYWLTRLNLHGGLRIWGWSEPPDTAATIHRVRPWSTNRSTAGFVQSQRQQNLPSFAVCLCALSCHDNICAVHVARHGEEF